MSEEQQSLQTHLQNLPERNASWRWVYLKAQQAEGIEPITKAVTAAEDAIFARWLELSGQAGEVQEREQLHEATSELLKIKTEKLHWPKPSF